MRTPFAFVTVLIAIILSCGNPPAAEQKTEPAPQPSADGLTAWTNAMKASILGDYGKGVDSTVYLPLEDPSFFQKLEYRGGMLKQKKYISRDSLTIFEIYTAGANGEFELRRKFCPNGQMAYEGITLNGEHYGMDMWWHCNGKVEHKGLRFASKYFGKWPYFKEDGTADHEDNFGLMEYLDSLSTVKFSGAD